MPAALASQPHRPISQLYCKRLAPENAGAFLNASPDHVGWQINLNKVRDDKAIFDAAIASSQAIARLLRDRGVKSVFLAHPSTAADELVAIVRAVAPDIFLASAERTPETLALVAKKTSAKIMVPIGIPVAGSILTGYDPLEEVERYRSLADWFTTDTINPSDAVDRFGCSGKTSDWAQLKNVVLSAPAPVVAAGGLSPENVADLWDQTRPAGFDAHTAVCTEGVPDEAKAVRFCDAVRALATTYEGPRDRV